MNGLAPAANHRASRGQVLQAAIRVGDANRPRVNKLRMAFDYLNTQRGVALYTVVGRDGANDGRAPAP